jgi:hypothetical protein
MLNFNEFVKMNENYKSDHTAPSKEDSPIYDLTDTYPDDIYSNKGSYLYGDHNDYYSDEYSINIIKQARNKPNYPIKIYRAIPNLNKSITSEIKKINDILNYKEKFGFFQMKNKIVDDIKNKYYDDGIGYKIQYDELQNVITSELENRRKELSNNKEKISINDGDWITINPEYAKEHGKNNIGDYIILTKTVKAKNLYTDGNSIHEFGYYS